MFLVCLDNYVLNYFYQHAQQEGLVEIREDYVEKSSSADQSKSGRFWALDFAVSTQ